MYSSVIFGIFTGLCNCYCNLRTFRPPKRSPMPISSYSPSLNPQRLATTNWHTTL